MNIVSPALALAVKAYQRFISPHKGFCCAHRHHHGGESCSAYALRVLGEHGVGHALVRILRRLDACEMAFARLKADDSGKQKKEEEDQERARKANRGDGRSAPSTCSTYRDSNCGPDACRKTDVCVCASSIESCI